jgi:hypothetical protein|tara:strand:- start:5545 stop:5772 length:228 start_codon:yes stop_codon:yes gene_type:complete
MNGWKVLAIILIVVVVLETGLIVWAYNWGTEAAENESACSINVCMNYDAYIYDDYEKICYCYEGNEIVHQEFIGG